ncbi:ribosomal-protein-alanine N-acetyltransferase [Tumebacillus sp. BK434]|uniref:GNAT family N-acetyltransferase n=1 Tax=Tumebacillus sp. BK434 TaxID=2512169 RepID=UPI0010D0ED00|nr:GNAT family protein [Tumebacillus sp. BK434]TCP59239.1 ribosomal-protein-alanine N-acetyltransferase [Tumebacillus sp. BK434]
MSDIEIRLITEADYEEVIDFEISNREFLRKTVPGRDDDRFYHPKRLRELVEQQVAAHRTGERFSYLIHNRKGDLVGRCHLYDIMRGPRQKAEIGCHLDRLHAGHGIASKALRLLMREAFETHRLHRLEASTLTTNVPAQMAVLRLGFQYVGRSEKYILLNQEWRDCVHFAIVNPNWEGLKR